MVQRYKDCNISCQCNSIVQKIDYIQRCSFIQLYPSLILILGSLGMYTYRNKASLELDSVILVFTLGKAQTIIPPSSSTFIILFTEVFFLRMLQRYQLNKFNKENSQRNKIPLSGFNIVNLYLVTTMQHFNQTDLMSKMNVYIRPRHLFFCTSIKLPISDSGTQKKSQLYEKLAKLYRTFRTCANSFFCFIFQNNFETNSLIIYKCTYSAPISGVTTGILGGSLNPGLATQGVPKFKTLQ